MSHLNNFKQLINQQVPKIICVGKNYLKHIKQMGGTEAPKKPVLFQKPWTSLRLSPTILSLPQVSKNHRIDHEIELGVMISKNGNLSVTITANIGSNIPLQQAMSHVGGYFLALDLTDRDLQCEAKSKGLPWCIAKGMDGFCPVSDLFKIEKQNAQKAMKSFNPYDIELEMIVNGEIRQKDLTRNMHFKIDEIISYTSEHMTLNDGDLILMGTPDGVGPLKDGDKVKAYARKVNQEGKPGDNNEVLGEMQFEMRWTTQKKGV